jgi:hypothetical protein
MKIVAARNHQPQSQRTAPSPPIGSIYTSNLTYEGGDSWNVDLAFTDLKGESCAFTVQSEITGGGIGSTGFSFGLQSIRSNYSHWPDNFSVMAPTVDSGTFYFKITVNCPSGATNTVSTQAFSASSQEVGQHYGPAAKNTQ